MRVVIACAQKISFDATQNRCFLLTWIRRTRNSGVVMHARDSRCASSALAAGMQNGDGPLIADLDRHDRIDCSPQTRGGLEHRCARAASMEAGGASGSQATTE